MNIYQAISKARTNTTPTLATICIAWHNAYGAKRVEDSNPFLSTASVAYCLASNRELRGAFITKFGSSALTQFDRWVIDATELVHPKGTAGKASLGQIIVDTCGNF